MNAVVKPKGGHVEFKRFWLYVYICWEYKCWNDFRSLGNCSRYWKTLTGKPFCVILKWHIFHISASVLHLQKRFWSCTAIYNLARSILFCFISLFQIIFGVLSFSFLQCSLAFRIVLLVAVLLVIFNCLQAFHFIQLTSFPQSIPQLKNYLRASLWFMTTLEGHFRFMPHSLMAVNSKTCMREWMKLWIPGAVCTIPMMHAATRWASCSACIATAMRTVWCRCTPPLPSIQLLPPTQVPCTTSMAIGCIMISVFLDMADRHPRGRSVGKVKHQDGMGLAEHVLSMDYSLRYDRKLTLRPWTIKLSKTENI